MPTSCLADGAEHLADDCHDLELSDRTSPIYARVRVPTTCARADLRFARTTGDVRTFEINGKRKPDVRSGLLAAHLVGPSTGGQVGRAVGPQQRPLPTHRRDPAQSGGGAANWRGARSSGRSWAAGSYDHRSTGPHQHWCPRSPLPTRRLRPRSWTPEAPDRRIRSHPAGRAPPWNRGDRVLAAAASRRFR
jgi:hypothetical protein